MTAAPVTFDEATHTYWQAGRKVPGVTSVLAPLYGDLRFVDADLLEWKSQLGTAVHRAVELHALGGLVYSSLDPLVADYFQQYLVFEVETGYQVHESEKRVVSAHGYAGTLDQCGELNGRRGVLDVKCTAALSPAVALQLAAYLNAYNETSAARVAERWALRLYPGGYRLQKYKAQDFPGDLAAFLGLLAVNKWCAVNGAKQVKIGERKNG